MSKQYVLFTFCVKVVLLFCKVLKCKQYYYYYYAMADAETYFTAKMETLIEIPHSIPKKGGG